MASTIHPCCDPTSPCPIWTGTPTGEFITHNDIEMYISTSARALEKRKPSSSDNLEPHQDFVLLLLTEGHGIHLANAQLLADGFSAQLSCPVIMPDQFARQPWPTQIKMDVNPQQWLEWKERHEPHATDPILEQVIAYIYRTYGPHVKIGGVGYCFGGRYIMRLMGKGVMTVGVVNHPSFFSMEEVREMGEGKRLAVFAAERDDILPAAKRRAMEDVLSETGATWQSTVFSGTQHGFAVRGDLTIKEVRAAKEKAFKGAVEWLREWLL